MKSIHYLMLAMMCLLAACNNHSEEDIYTRLPIVSELESQSTVLDWGKMTTEQRRKYPRKGFVINSVDDFPTEQNINLNDLKLLDVDFNKYTLLVNYTLIPGYIKGHNLLWYYDNAMDEYVFQSNFMIIKPGDNSDANDDLFTYYRSAIIVDKIKSDKKVSFYFTY